MRPLLFVCATLLASVALAAGGELQLSYYQWRAWQILERYQADPQDTAERQAFWQKLLDDPATDRADRTIALREMKVIALVFGRLQELTAACKADPPAADDYEAQGWCLYADDSVSIQARVQAYTHMFERARAEMPRSYVPSAVATLASADFARLHDSPHAVSILSQALEHLPAEAHEERARLRRSMAFLYVGPTNSEWIVRQGIELFNQVEAYFNTTSNWEEKENTAFNKAVAFIFNLQDYAGAVKELNKIQRDPSLLTDARVFLAFAEAKLQRYPQALAALEQAKLDQYEDEGRKPFLECYASLVRSMASGSDDLRACFKLPNSTQSDVFLHLTEELHQRPLKTEEELILWRQFHWFYENKILPSIRSNLEHSMDGLELQRTRYESQMKDQRSQIKTYALIGSVLLLGLFALGWYRVRKLHLFIRTQVLQRFLPPELIADIVAGRNRLDEHARVMTVTVLFADLSNFSQHSEALGPERIAVILNTYLRSMTEVIFAHRGTIDKFIGDGIMVIFGAPTELGASEQVERSVHCARAMQAELERLNQIWMKEGNPAFQMRVGLHQGPAVVGSFGGEKRADFTAIGGTVNMASRIENLAEPGQILVSAHIAQQLSAAEVHDIGRHSLKGVDKPQQLYALKSAVETQWAQAPSA